MGQDCSDRWLGSTAWKEAFFKARCWVPTTTSWALTSAQGHQVSSHLLTLQMGKQKLRAVTMLPEAMLLVSGQVWLGTQVCYTLVCPKLELLPACFPVHLQGSWFNHHHFLSRLLTCLPVTCFLTYNT